MLHRSGRSATARMRAFCFAALASFSAAAANAQPLPDKPIRIVVPQPAGGGTDIVARLLADELSKSLGRTFFVDNRPGANGTMGAVAVAHSQADGSSLLFVPASVMTLNPHLIKQLPYDPVKTFMPVAYAGETTVALAVASRSPHQTFAEFVAAGKRAPKGVSYGIPQVAGMPHLLGEIVRLSTGVDMVAVPFRGGAGVATALQGGDVEVITDSVTSIGALVREGKARALVLGSAQRLPEFPNVPTLSEIVPGAEARGWFGLFAPAGTPDAVVRVLNEAVRHIIAQPASRERLLQLGMYPTADNTPAGLGARVASDIRRYGEVIRARNIAIE